MPGADGTRLFLTASGNFLTFQKLPAIWIAKKSCLALSFVWGNWEAMSRWPTTNCITGWCKNGLFHNPYIEVNFSVCSWIVISTEAIAYKIHKYHKSDGRFKWFWLNFRSLYRAQYVQFHTASKRSKWLFEWWCETEAWSSCRVDWVDLARREKNGRGSVFLMKSGFS